jgi:hypothetical protein
MEVRKFPKAVVDSMKRHEVFVEAKRYLDNRVGLVINELIRSDDPMIKNRLSGYVEGIAEVFRTFDSLAENAQSTDLAPVVPSVDITISGSPKVGL